MSPRASAPPRGAGDEEGTDKSQIPAPPPASSPSGLGISRAGFFSLLTFGWVNPLVVLGARKELSLHDGMEFFGEADHATGLADQFDRSWRATVEEEERQSAAGNPPSKKHTMAKALLRLHRGTLLKHCVWSLVEIAFRLSGPIMIRTFLNWLEGNAIDSNTSPDWQGWVIVAGLGLLSFGQAVAHHHLFWTGMRMGLQMRVQAMLAVHSKVLRLNSAAVSNFSTGKVVNLVSNDAARFDEALIMWPFLWAGPLELVAVIILLAFELGILPALAGAATLVLLVPVQSWLSKYVYKLRSASTKVTDERVRLTSEVITGALAMKMHCWEERLAEKLSALRQGEVYHKGRTAQIKAAGFALQFALTPLITLATFAAVMATSVELNIPLVFYAIALLHLPKLYVATFFVRAVETVTELRVAVSRMNEFLNMREPDQPATAITSPQSSTSASEKSTSEDPGLVDHHQVCVSARPVAVSLNGGDFSWENWSGHAEAPPALDSEEAKAVEKGQAGALVAGESGRRQAITLSGVNLDVYMGELLGVCGEVGSGKSSLLAALMGEMQPLGGTGGPVIRGRVAYCSQVPWVMADTLEGNVLFGRPAQDSKYQDALSACALTSDIAQLPAGDQTELGERGINLSGGQKARLALARAAYSEADVMLLDDPLSAVDTKVGRHIFHKCISSNGVMAGTTRVLVTHQKQYLPHCSRIAVLRKGRLVAVGSWSELREMDLPELEGVDQSLAGTIEDYPDEMTVHAAESYVSTEHEYQDKQYKDLKTSDAAKEPQLHSTFSVAVEKGITAQGAVGGGMRQNSSYGSLSRLGSIFGSPSYPDDGSGSQHGPGASSLRRALSRMRGPNNRHKDPTSAEQDMKVGSLVKAEGRQTGGVSWGVYLAYVRYTGYFSSALIFLAAMTGTAAWFFTQYWVGLWAAAPAEEQVDDRWIEMLGILTVVCVVLAAARSSLFFEKTLRAATKMHNEMALAVLRSPLRFFHTNPTGRILNRFSKDLGTMDDMLPIVSIDTLNFVFVIGGSFVLALLAAWPVVFVMVPLFLCFIWVRQRYITTSREVKRYEAISRSPLYASFSAMIKGLATVRAYGCQEHFHKTFMDNQNINTSWFFCFLGTARWIGFRLDMMSVATLIGVSAGAVLLKSSISLALLGVALTNSLELAALLQWTVRQSAEVENNMTATERLIEYTKLPREPPTVSEGAPKAPEGWPHSPKPADVVFTGLTATYGAHLSPVLSNLSFTIPAGTSCGIVGRTGSGKSSLMLTLFRLIDTTEGHITIGGLDISSIGIDALRHQLAIIPQDPVLFSGTLRSNLDPWEKIEDAKLWDVLRLVRLNEAVGDLGGLDAAMSEGGDNWSVGQRQLLCLARSLLQDAAILALDEATANVDRETDAAIQAAIRTVVGAGTEGGVKRTLLVIAHRIDTIMDCDQLLVLSRGALVEAGSPAELVRREDGMFAGLVSAAAAGGMGVTAVGDENGDVVAAVRDASVTIQEEEGTRGQEEE